MTKKDRKVRLILNGVLAAAVVAAGAAGIHYSRVEDARQLQEEERQQASLEEDMETEILDADTSRADAGLEEDSASETSEAEDGLEENEAVDVGTSEVEAEMEDFSEEPADAAASGEEDTAEGKAEEMASETEDPGNMQTAKADTGTQDTLPQQEAMSSEEIPQAAASSAVEQNFTENTPMVWPLAGDILLDYSMDKTIYHPTLDVYKYSPGIVISAAVDSPVLAAAGGLISSITEEADTGTTVTVDMGNGYQAIYGQLQNVQVQQDQQIQESAVLGYVANPTKYYSVEGSNLYFAMKKDGQAIDPVIYLP